MWGLLSSTCVTLFPVAGRVDWVITHPIIWNHAALKLIRTAAEDAGMPRCVSAFRPIACQEPQSTIRVGSNELLLCFTVIVYSFFLMKAHMESKDIDIKLVSASNKLKVKHKADLSHITTTSKYAQNKQHVVAHVRNYLQLTQSINAEWIERFARVKKADDWADAYAQALHYIENTLS
jgi:hypothetical protein